MNSGRQRPRGTWFHCLAIRRKRGGTWQLVEWACVAGFVLAPVRGSRNRWQE